MDELVSIRCEDFSDEVRNEMEKQAVSLREELVLAAAGNPSQVELYWDKQDQNNPGPAYRYLDGSESGPCDVTGWSDACRPRVSIEDYFDGDGKYLGPDSEGVYPIFA